jgi:hypothetical protein
MAMVDNALDTFGRFIARRLGTPTSGRRPTPTRGYDQLMRILRPCDILLIEGGNSKISTAIKYLTQSTWSHAALYVGDRLGVADPDGMAHVLIEAELGEGVVSSPLSKYADYNVRVCRAKGLEPEDREAVMRYAIDRIGHKYDLRNILDLMRYMLPTPPVPVRFRRKLIGLGSGDPTRAICSTLIAQAFQSVRYPILPSVEVVGTEEGRREILTARHYSLFAPRDFDISPYFDIVKPLIAEHFDYRAIHWSGQEPPDRCRVVVDE